MGGNRLQQLDLNLSLGGGHWVQILASMASNEAMVEMFLLHLIVASLWWCGLWPNAVCGFQFNNVRFDSIDGFLFQKPHDNPKGSVPVWSDHSVLLTPDPTSTLKEHQLYNVGRLLYNHPLQFMPDSTQQVVSFTTSFTFQILTTSEYGSCGDGIAFTVTSDVEVPVNSAGQYLGLASQSSSAESRNQPFFAVEFDTFKNPQPQINDPSASHIGIDINGLKSVASLDTSSNNSKFFPELFLYNNYTFTAWVDYNASSQLIRVWMTNSSTDQRPPEPCLSAHYDLSQVFRKEMYVGISAASGNKSQGNVVYSWNFSIVEDVKRKIEHKRLVLVVSLAPPALCCIAAAAGILAVRMKKLAIHRKSDIPGMETASLTIPRYSYGKLKRASQRFSEMAKVGGGGFSSVYKGILPDGTQVAVKRLKHGLRLEAELGTEVQIISQIRHRNLLQLKGWCYEKGEALLVYQFMPNGSLDSHLFGKKKGSQLLNSETKFKILVGVAAALEYLHGGLGGCVLHRDVKAANVLLTEKFEAILGDFGLARLITHDQIVTMTAAGTPGYVAPEVVYTGKATDKADVYSFGVLALEVACGRRTLDASSEIPLVNWVWLIHQRSNIIDALDPNLLQTRNEGNELKWRCGLHLGLLCCHPWPEARPTMRQVHQALQETIVLPLPSSRPMYPGTYACTAVSSSSSRSLGRSAPSLCAVPSASLLS